MSEESPPWPGFVDLRRLSLARLIDPRDGRIDDLVVPAQALFYPTLVLGGKGSRRCHFCRTGDAAGQGDVYSYKVEWTEDRYDGGSFEIWSVD